MKTRFGLVAAILLLAVSTRSDTSSIDLTMTALSGAPASSATGKTFSLTNAVKTTGAVTKSFTIGFYLSSDATITTADTLIGTRTVASLAANGTSTATTTVTVPVTLAPGTYYVGAIADSTGVIAETNETNNWIRGTQVQIAGSDLSMTSLTGAPGSTVPGATFSLTSTVAASSTGGAAGAFSIGFYLSTDATITTADTLIGTRAVASLAPGGTSSAATTVTVPSTMPAGTYYVGAIADYLNQVVESNEANNAIVGTQVVVGRPDLSMTGFSGVPASIGPSDSFSVTDTVSASATGLAAGQFYVGYYLSTSSTITTSGTLLGTRLVPGLSPGQISTATTTLAIPVGTLAGTYYVGAIADSTGLIAESNEANNSISGGVVHVGAYSC